MVDKVGNVLSMAGILVTFFAYGVEHRGRGLAELEPGLARIWRASGDWLRHHLRRTKGQTVHAGIATAVAVGGLSATVEVWSPRLPEDDLATRIGKVETNLDGLRQYTYNATAKERGRAVEAERQLTENVNSLRDDLAEREAKSRDVETAAMRLQVRGLGIALLGTLLSLFG